jgi:predicted nucleic acid-binding protein
MSYPEAARQGPLESRGERVIAIEQARPTAGRPPELISVSVITIGELRVGVLAASDAASRARRLDTLSFAEGLDPLPVDMHVAHA